VPGRPLAADSAALSRVLSVAGVTRESLIRVTGAAGPAATLWLAQHGYGRAAYVHPRRVADMEPADALLIPSVCPADELAQILQSGACLREGGVLIVQTPSSRSSAGVDMIPAVLKPLRYAEEQRLRDRGREVRIARRRGFGFKAAA
jgi:hypothetical protein